MDSYLNSDEYKSTQKDILELAVKVVVHPSYGWITASLIIYGCRPKEVFSLIPYHNGEATVLEINSKSQNYKTRKVLAIPSDFVEKLNLFDQVSKPISYTNINDFNEEEVNNIMKKWLKWFMEVEQKYKINDLRHFWAFRSIQKGIPSYLAANSLGMSLEEFNNKYPFKKRYL